VLSGVIVGDHARITIGESVRQTEVSRTTLKQHSRNLVERGHLNQHGSGRGVWYDLR
jgi:predicted HTH transcriptional regulator